MKDLVDKHLIFDTGDHFGFAAILRADQHIDKVN